MQSFTQIERIGKGAYGTVFKARDAHTGQTVALKMITLVPGTEGVPCTAIREIAILSQLTHKNVVRLLSTFHNKKYLVLVFEYCQYDMGRILRRSKLSNIEIVSFSYQLLSAVCEIHEHSIIHRDIKPQNLLVNERGVLKLCDFGLSRLMNVPCEQLSVDVVTQWYRAPEILLKCKNYSFASDIWSVGCVIAEMMSGRPLFPFSEDQPQLSRIFGLLGKPTDEEWPGLSRMETCPSTITVGSSLREMFKDHDTRLVELLECLLKVSPKQRVTAKEALSFPIFEEIHTVF